MIPIPQARTLAIMLSCICSLLFSKEAFSQKPEPIKRHVREFSPEGLLDHVFDDRGHEYTLGQIAIDNGTRADAWGGEAMAIPASCSSGHFQLYLEAGCGMEGTSAAEIARLNVLCQVLRDISALINSPCTITGQKVNIWVKKSITGAAGIGSPFYNIPYSTTASGIADNTIWQTLNSGRDAFIGVAGPLSTSGGGSSGTAFFHGSIAFNFSGALTWHTNLATVPATGETDMYTVALHEMLHAMGFGSLVDYNGLSVFGAGYKYFSRYDTHLKTSGGTPLITAGTAGCNLYNNDINPALAPISSYLSPGGTGVCPSGYTSSTSDHTICANSLVYTGSWTTGIPVYTPQCFEKGSSLSHLEDECYVPAGFSLGSAGPATNNQYFVMSNSGSVGPYSPTNLASMKRYPTAEERKVLCDIGYSANTTFGSAATLNYISYGGTACPGIPVVGMNDGITASATFTYTTIPTGGVNINPGTSPMLANDYGTTGGSFKCLEVVYGAGTFSTTTGTATSSVIFTAAAGAHGVQLLRYIPVSSTGVEGNITYVFVYVMDLGCLPSPCDLVANGSFENTTSSTPGPLGGIRCWGRFAETPDRFLRGCTSSPAYCFPPFSWFLQDSTRPFGTSPNNNFVGAVSGFSFSSGPRAEALQGQLSSSPLPGNTYLVSFWAKYADALLSPSSKLPTYVQIAVNTAVSSVPFSTLLSGPPAGVTPLCNILLSHPDPEWHYYHQYVTYSGPSVNSIALFPAPWLNPTTGPYAVPSGGASSGYGDYLVFDDVSIIPLSEASSFVLPDTIDYCHLLDLEPLVSIPGGYFSWFRDSSGHSVVSHSSSFDPANAYNCSILRGDTGVVTVCYNYTSPSGCSRQVCDETFLRNPLSPITGPGLICRGATATLTNALTGGTWASSTLAVGTIGSASGVVGGVSGGSTIITYAHPSGCYAAKRVTVEPMPITGPTAICVGAAITLFDATPGGTWSSGNPAVATIAAVSGVYTGVSVGSATISYMAPSGCLATTIVHVGPLPVTGTTLLCTGMYATLYNTAPSGMWVSSDPSIATVGGTTGLVTGISAGTVSIDYILPGGCFSSITVTVIPMPILGATPISVGGSTLLTTAATGGTWTTSNPAIATISSSGLVTGVSPGTVVIQYVLPIDCPAMTIVTVNGSTTTEFVTAQKRHLSVVPNPTADAFLLTCTDLDGTIAEIEITDILGKTVLTESAAIVNGRLEKDIRMSEALSGGIYFIRVTTGTTSQLASFVLDRSQR